MTTGGVCASVRAMVTLPGSTSAAGRSDQRGDPASAPAVGVQRLALIVEGDSPIGSALSDTLAPHGWRTLVTRSPEAALRVAHEHAFDLLVADFQLGATSGESLADRLRRGRASFPVVLMSGLHDEARIELWPAAAFMPTILRVDMLVSRICAMFDAPHLSLSTADIDQTARRSGWPS